MLDSDLLGTSMTINKSDSTSKVVVGVSTGKKGPDGRGVAESPQPKVLKKQGTVSNLVGKDESSAKHLDAEREKDLSAAAEVCDIIFGGRKLKRLFVFSYVSK